MQICLFDTNVLVLRSTYLFRRRLSEQDLGYIKFYKKTPLPNRCVPSFILAEYEIVMKRVIPKRYKFDKEDKAQLDKILAYDLRSLSEDSQVFHPDSDEFGLAVDWYLEYGKMSLIDYWLCSVANKTGFPIVSRDDKLISFAKKRDVPCFLP